MTSTCRAGIALFFFFMCLQVHATVAKLFSGARTGNLHKVNQALKRGTSTHHTQGEEEWTALHVAVNAGHYNIVERLIHAAANIDAQDKLGKTPLHLALERGDDDITKLLLQSGADSEIADNENVTSYQLATQKERTDLAVLMDRNKRFNLIDTLADPTINPFAPLLLYLSPTVRLKSR